MLYTHGRKVRPENSLRNHAKIQNRTPPKFPLAFHAQWPMFLLGTQGLTVGYRNQNRPPKLNTMQIGGSNEGDKGDGGGLPKRRSTAKCYTIL